MVVSGFVFHVSSGFLVAGEEARKKKPFFPEDIVDSDSLFHLCLLLVTLAPACKCRCCEEWRLSATTKQSPLHFEHEIASGRLRLTSQPKALAMTYVIIKKPFIHIRDEEFSAVPPGLPTVDSFLVDH
jgi:hypothetical protein